MKIRLSDHFDYPRLLRFTLPSIVMMIFTSIYSVVDGVFVSQFVGTTPFAAINLIMPFAQIMSCVGFMFGTGGSALVSARLGAKDARAANRIFSMLVWIGGGIGVVFAVLSELFMERIALLMGASEAMLPYCVTYGRILSAALPVYILQNMFQSFLVTAERPDMGLAVTVAAGVTNMVLDALFIIVFDWGLAGAAAATVISVCVGGFVPLVYFTARKTEGLRLGGPAFDGRALLHTCTNGSSEFVTNISMSVVSMLYNWQLMRLAGEDGVAAYGAVMYVSFIFVAIFLGYSMGVAPVVSYHYGAENTAEVQSLLHKSLKLILGASVVLAALAFALSRPLAALFSGGSEALLHMTQTAFQFYAIAVLFSGFNIFGSAFFTALNNGFVSAAISFLRTFLFEVVTVLILPQLFALNGVWYSLFTAEILSVFVTAAFFVRNRKRYAY